MSRPPLVLGWAVLLLCCTASVGAAQFSEPVLGDEPTLPPKMLARLAWEAVHADPRDLARSKVEAARLVSGARQKEFLAGRGTLDYILESSRNLLESERAASGSAATQLIALERHWARTKMIEDVNNTRHEAKRIPIQDYMQSKYERLGAEISLIEARVKSGKALNMQGTYADVVAIDPLDADLAWEAQQETPAAAAALGFSAKWLAQWRFEVGGANLVELAKAKLDAAKTVYEAREKEFMSGRGTFLLEASLRLLEAERSVGDTEIEQQAALEGYCARAQQFEAINRKRFDSSRIPIQDWAETRYRLLEGEIWLAQARAKSGKAAIGGGIRAAMPLPGEKSHFIGDPLESRDWARAEFEAMSTDPSALVRAKLDAARIAFGARVKEFLRGSGTLDFVLESSLRVIDSELAQTDNQVDRLAALERHWTQKKIGEIIAVERFESGRIPVQDCAAAVYGRLKAEIRLAEARKGREKK